VVAVWLPSVDALAGPTSSPATEPDRALLAPPITWRGWDGIHPGENLRTAARHLRHGLRTDPYCGRPYKIMKGLGTHMKVINAPAALNKVAVISWWSPKLRGPDGITVGMSIKTARAHAQAHQDKVHTIQGVNWEYWIRGKDGRIFDFWAAWPPGFPGHPNSPIGEEVLAMNRQVLDNPCVR
jgi:hypothetical protein